MKNELLKLTMMNRGEINAQLHVCIYCIDLAEYVSCHATYFQDYLFEITVGPGTKKNCCHAAL